MFDKRVDRLKRGMKRKPKTDKLDVESRHEALLKVEGWYKCEAALEDLPYIYQPLVREYKNSGSTMKFTRWLSRKEALTHDVISEIGKLLQSNISFKLSCRHTDLLRLPESKHYFSCFGSWRGVQQLRYLADPDVAIVYVPDASGKYKWRALIRLMLDPNDSTKYVFAIHKSYGNSNERAILKRLNEIYPLYTQYYGYSRVCFNTLCSATQHHNRIVGDHVWSDHYCALNRTTMRLEMRCVPYTE